MQTETSYTLSSQIMESQLEVPRLVLAREQYGESGSHSLLEKVDTGIVVNS